MKANRTFMITFSLLYVEIAVALGAVSSIYYLFRGNKKLILLPELIPYSMHYKNVRAILSPAHWQSVAKISYRNSHYKCDICNVKGKIECHEIWQFDDRNLQQKLIGLTTLCVDCHRVKHIGLAKKMGYYNTTIKHMAKVNKISISQAERHVAYAEIEVKKRRGDYALDLTYLNTFSSSLPRRYTSYENGSCADIKGNA